MADTKKATWRGDTQPAALNVCESYRIPTLARVKAASFRLAIWLFAVGVL
ncbi:MAG: hypothetical protein H6R26_660 [Proteobacteria bacterium]|nr:hypothetical protein [Pseudomonadota bacterium]